MKDPGFKELKYISTGHSPSINEQRIKKFLQRDCGESRSLDYLHYEISGEEILYL